MEDDLDWLLEQVGERAENSFSFTVGWGRCSFKRPHGWLPWSVGLRCAACTPLFEAHLSSKNLVKYPPTSRKSSWASQTRASFHF